MTLEADGIDRPADDPVSNVLKWVLLVVAVASFAILGWTTKLTYEAAPPLPDQFVTSGQTVLMSAADIEAGKAGFQKADLMDYGSLYGMGSYFGEDYTGPCRPCRFSRKRANCRGRSPASAQPRRALP